MLTTDGERTLQSNTKTPTWIIRKMLDIGPSDQSVRIGAFCYLFTQLMFTFFSFAVPLSLLDLLLWTKTCCLDH